MSKGFVLFAMLRSNDMIFTFSVVPTKRFLDGMNLILTRLGSSCFTCEYIVSQ